MLKEKIKPYIPENTKVEFFSNVAIFEVPVAQIKKVIGNLYGDKDFSLKLITATDERKNEGGFKIWYIFGVPEEKAFVIVFMQLKNTDEFPSLAADIHEAWNYERKIQTFFGLIPVGHPSPKRIILHENWPMEKFPLRKDFDWRERPSEAKGEYKFQKVKGEGIYEIPVGPVHAGIIEPGHFRFSVAGEEIVLLEAKLGYKHKGTEKLWEILPLPDKVRLSERVSGDTSFTHSLAFCQALESLAEIEVSARVKYLRVIFSELERLANHFNDIGFILSDTGYSFGGSHGGRLREKIMQWNEQLTGSRFLRGVNMIGGITQDISPAAREKLLLELKKMQKDFMEIMEISENSSSVLNRLQGTGKLDHQIAVDHGVIGIAGRAMGIEHDARKEYPYAVYDKLNFTVALEKEGDVQARLRVRIKEVYSSLEIIEQALKNLPSDGELKSEKEINLRKDSCAVGITEGWRGEIVYFVVTDKEGNISRVDVRDPSFINWAVLGYAGKGNVVPDFPLINKSFNLSYSGNDL